ncbi:hypothetical protein NQ314_009914 [Rhamnusium bicolor]|uniref:BESS domain-containing protein n=1 Tax=Rhamnusium bicolor TaxID=1586634 RepID=A0AAV8XX49_9CUCU|nr:hypothetical protein NQ314_009914 [Rhamnusium bicolor]
MRQSDQTVHQHTTNDLTTAGNPIHHFFMSLLPEFESMTEDEIRSFKIRVMVLIDEIKSKHCQRTPHSATSTVA